MAGLGDPTPKSKHASSGVHRDDSLAKDAPVALPAGEHRQQNKTDTDSQSFRENSVRRVHEALLEVLDTVRTALRDGSLASSPALLNQWADQLNTAIVDAPNGEVARSTSDTAIVHALGMTIWNRPADPSNVSRTCGEKLLTQFQTGAIDADRLSQGAYLLEVLTHKYKDGNGRAARAIKAVFENAANDQGIEADEVKQILGVGKEALSQTGEHSFRINFHPDFERIVLGIAYFGLHKGLSQDRVVQDLRLNSLMPEQGLEALAQELRIPKARLREEFISFMVCESDLSWCNF